MGVIEIILAILGISLLVIVHEGGHYLAARAFGMRVLRFSIGFGPTLFKYQPKGSPTIFQVAAIPFLAYVQIAGMNPHEDVDPEDPEIYPNKGVFARIVTIFAGPFANYLTASLLVFGIALVAWPPAAEPTSPMEVREVSEGYPAADAGIQVGDLIVEANGRAVANVDELIEVTAPRPGEATEYVVRRGDERLTLTITPKDVDGRGIIGVQSATQPVALGVGDAAKAALIFPFQFTVMQLEALGQMITSGETGDVKGPVGMGKLVAEQAGKGVLDYIWILMVLSIALGMFNLLPIPALDGGRLVFLGYELVTRQRPNERFETAVHMVGLIFLLGVIVLVTFRDIFYG